MEGWAGFLARDWPTFWTAVGAIAPTLALVGSYLAWRRSEENRRREDLRLNEAKEAEDLRLSLDREQKSLRLNDVLSWSTDAIRALQELRFLIHSDALSEEDARRLAIETSSLAEIGRLFFKNEDRGDEHGKEKLPPYRGHRPSILDPLVLAHQIACEFEEASADDRKRYCVVLTKAEGRFVTLAQQEIGREKTAHKSTSVGGSGDKLEELAVAVTATDLSEPHRKYL